MPINFAQLHKHAKISLSDCKFVLVDIMDSEDTHLGSRVVAVLLDSCVALGRLHDLSRPVSPFVKLRQQQYLIGFL